MPRSRTALLTVLAALLAPALLLGCSDDGDDAGATTTTAEAGDDDETSTDDGGDGGDDDDTEAPTGELVDTPFCQNLLAVEQVDAGGDDDSPEAVLEGADEVQELIDAALAAKPADAPAEVDTFLGDTKAFVGAVIAADGDVTAAFTELQSSNPELVRRISEQGAYQAAADYVFTSCGVDIGGAEGATGTEG